MKKIGRAIIIVLMYGVYIVLWYFIVGFAHLVKINGLFYLFEDFFGQWSVFLGVAIAVVVSMAPLYLRKWIRQGRFNRELKISAVSLMITLLFIVFSIGAYFLMEWQFHDFTPERWQEYPRERWIMVYDLIDKHGIVGMEYDQAVELLGKPDEIASSGSLLYWYNEGYTTKVFLDANNCVKSINVY